MRAFPVVLPSGARYWTVLDEDLAVVPVADGFLRQVRFGRDGAESTTKSYAHSIALFLRWCARTGRTWQAGAGQLGLFMTWLAHAGPAVSRDGATTQGMVLAGPGSAPARGAGRVNGVLSAVRGMVVHAVAAGQASGDLVALVYEVADDRDLPGAARGEDGRMRWRMRAGMPVRLRYIVIDAHDLPGLARFWTQALGWRVLSERENEVVIGTDENAPAGIMPVTDPKTVKDRVHLDLTGSAADRDQEIDRLLALGARRVGIGQTGAESWTVLADPEGNEFCVVRPREALIR